MLGWGLFDPGGKSGYLCISHSTQGPEEVQNSRDVQGSYMEYSIRSKVHGVRYLEYISCSTVPVVQYLEYSTSEYSTWSTLPGDHEPGL